jgi:predicted amidophosphoribosyltransferase
VTSQTCTRCNGEVRHSRRNNICEKCRFKINRDVEASREIGARDARIKMRELLRQRNSAGARPSYPVPAQWNASVPGLMMR